MKPDYTTIRQAHPWQKLFNLAVLISILVIAYNTGQATHDIAATNARQQQIAASMKSTVSTLAESLLYLNRNVTNLEDRATAQHVITLNQLQRMANKPENWIRVKTNDHWQIIYQP